MLSLKLEGSNEIEDFSLIKIDIEGAEELLFRPIPTQQQKSRHMAQHPSTILCR